MAGHRACSADCVDVPRFVLFQKKTDVKHGEETHWRNLFASIVKNTSLTVRDIEELRINQMEDLLIGLGENAEAEEAYLNGDTKQELLEETKDITLLLSP